MRKVILQLAVSLDGFIEGPKGEFDWCFTDQDYGMSAFLKRVDSVLMGRKSYELSSSMKVENNWIPPMTTYVFSNRLTSVGNDAILISGDIKTKMNKLKKEDGKDFWLFGGAALCSSFMELGLVDELMLAVHPVLLGKGKPLFTGLDKRIKLKLVDTKTYDTGLVFLTYTLAGKK
jgi:dihydrofolate reductase